MTLDLILIGLTIALEPLPLTAYLLVLSSKGGIRKGWGFLIGWVGTLVGIVVLTLALTGGKPPRPGTVPSTTALVVQIALGLGLLFVAWRQQARRGRPKRPPSWLAKVDHMSVPAAIALGFLVQPWPLVAAGAASVMQADLSETSSVIALILFCLLATGSYLVMQVYVSVAPATAGVRLRGLNDWIGSHTDQIIIGVSAFIGAWLIARGAYQLLS
jgi:hypothetical protein